MDAEKERRDQIHRTPAFVCSHVFEQTHPVLYVCRPFEDWQLLCGQNEAECSGGPRLVGLSHLVARDPTLAEILDLPEYWEAFRTAVGEPWERSPTEPQEGGAITEDEVFGSE